MAAGNHKLPIIDNGKIVFIEDKDIRKKLGVRDPSEAYTMLYNQFLWCHPSILRELDAYLRVTSSYWDAWSRTINQFKYSLAVTAIWGVIAPVIIPIFQSLLHSVPPSWSAWIFDGILVCFMVTIFIVNLPVARVLTKKWWADLMLEVLSDLHYR